MDDSKKKCSVLTFIFGKGYEKLHEPKCPDPDVEYVLVTDDRDLKSDVWKIVYDMSFEGMSGFEKCFRTRYNVFNYCSTDVCMTVDGSIAVDKFPWPLYNKFQEGNYDICLMPHPLWADFQTEYNAWIRMRNYPVANARRFFEFLTKAKYNLEYKSLFQLCFSMKRKSKATSDIDNMTFSLLKYLSTEDQFERLDQTVFSFVMNRYFCDLKVLPVSEQVVRSDYMTWYWHNTDKPNMNIFYDISKPDMKYVFNKEVECMYI